MAENDQDSGSPAGTSGATNTAGSQGQSVQPGSIDAAKVLSALEALDKKLAEVDARSKSLQGDKDRAVTKTTKEVEELKRQIAEIEKLKKAGLDPDAAVEEFSFREDIRAIKDQLSKLSPVSSTVPGKDTSGADEAAQVIQQYHLDGNDPAVLPLLTLKGAELKAAAADLAYRRATQPTPSPASAPAMQGSASAPVDQSALIAKVNQWQLNPSAHKDDLAKAYKELGWG